MKPHVQQIAMISTVIINIPIRLPLAVGSVLHNAGSHQLDQLHGSAFSYQLIKGCLPILLFLRRVVTNANR